jgi:hypothetical protein
VLRWVTRGSRVIARDLRAPAPVVEPKRHREILLESRIEVAARQLAVDRAERIEVPIVIEKIGSGFDRPARRRPIAGVTEICCGVIDARTGGKQIANARRPFSRQQSARVIESNGFQRGVQVDLASRHRGPVNHRDQTLARRG